PAAQLALELLARGLRGGLLAQALELLLGLGALGQLVGGAGFLQVLVDLARRGTGGGQRRGDVLGLLTGLTAYAGRGGGRGLSLVTRDAGGELGQGLGGGVERVAGLVGGGVRLGDDLLLLLDRGFRLGELGGELVQGRFGGAEALGVLVRLLGGGDGRDLGLE